MSQLTNLIDSNVHNYYASMQKFAATDVTTLQDFIKKYYKPNAIVGNLQILFDIHNVDLKRWGATVIEADQSTTGEPVYLSEETLTKAREDSRKFINDHFEFIVVR